MGSVTCVVPAGGAARRMGGVDKAALEVGGIRLLERVLGAARPVADVLVVVGPPRPTAVPGVEFVQESPPGGGPVPGVIAGLRHALGDVVLVVAADLPFVTAGDLRRLLDQLAATGADAAAALDDRGRPHPLLAAYRTADLRSRRRALGPDVAASQLLPPHLTVVPLRAGATVNVNSPADLEAANTAAFGDDPPQTTRWEPA